MSSVNKKAAKLKTVETWWPLPERQPKTFLESLKLALICLGWLVLFAAGVAGWGLAIRAAWRMPTLTQENQQLKDRVRELEKRWEERAPTAVRLGKSYEKIVGANPHDWKI